MNSYEAQMGILAKHCTA